MKPPATKESSLTSDAGAKSTPVVGPDVKPIVMSDVFVSQVEGPRSPEQRIERIEAILKYVGLPPLAEVNRMEAEAEAAAEAKKAAKRRK